MNEKSKILLAEDDTNLGILIKEFLVVKGYDAHLATDGQIAYEWANNQKWDLMLLDVMMPKMDGFTLAKEVREKDINTPIIFLTARSMQQDTIEGFKVGADDYVTKPFSMEELIMRIQAVLKRTQKEVEEIEVHESFKLGKYLFDYQSHKLIADDEVRKLSTRESQLLKLLCDHRNQVLERSVTLDIIWKEQNKLHSRNMDVYINKLRKALSDEPRIEILNMHGKGFKLIDIE
jgi:DNA-binding response OmpR family regulator